MRRLRLALILIAFIQFATNAAAHGGVSIEDDTCVMTIGTYRAHFTGYQPMARASQEFCEDIPVVAPAIIVLDFISQPLRDMQVDFRVVRDVNNIGVKATYEDLGGADEIRDATMYYRAAEQYPRGSLDVKIEFDTPGPYIGILTAVDTASGTAREYRSVFPFAVGVTNWWEKVRWIVLCMILGLGLWLWTNRSGSPEHAS